MSTRPRWSGPARPAATAEAAIRLSAITIPCARFAESVTFYAELVGLETQSRGGGRQVLDLGAARLVLLDASKMNGFSRGGQGLYLEVTVPDLSAARARLAGGGARVFAPRRGARNLLTVEDPEGNLVNLVQAAPD